MNQGQKVSAIIPTYNREKLVPRAIQSVLDQTWQNFELIVVDDGSTDRTEQVVSGFTDDRIRYVRLDKNSGVSHARNIGIESAQCEYIAFQDSDDEWLPEKLEKQMQVMLQAPETVGMVYCRMAGDNRAGKRRVCPPQDRKADELQGDMLLPLMIQNVVGTPSMLIRRACLEQVGGFDEGLRCLEDWELVLRIAEKYELGFVEDILVRIHYSEGSVSSEYTGYIETRCYMIAKYWKVMADNNILDEVMKDLLVKARYIGHYEEAKQLLSAVFGL